MTKFKEIATVITTHYGVSIEQIKSKSRDRKSGLMEARHMLFSLLYINTDYSLVQIGRYFKRDHTTVIHSVETIKNFVNAKYPTPEKTNYEQIKKLLSFEVRDYEPRATPRELLIED